MGLKERLLSLSIGVTQFDTKKANVRARAVREPPLLLSLSTGVTQFDTKKANVWARAVREPPLQRVDISGFPFSTASLLCLFRGYANRPIHRTLGVCKPPDSSNFGRMLYAPPSSRDTRISYDLRSGRDDHLLPGFGVGVGGLVQSLDHPFCGGVHRRKAQMQSADARRRCKAQMQSADAKRRCKAQVSRSSFVICAMSIFEAERGGRLGLCGGCMWQTEEVTC